MTLDSFLSRLDGVRRSGEQATARCPAHEDKHQSLSVSVAGLVSVTTTRGADVPHPPVNNGSEPDRLADAFKPKI